MKCALLAPGPSMSQAVADSVRDYALVIAIGNVGIDLAPWAHALVAQDRAWWRAHPEALNFAGRKFSSNKIDGVQQITSHVTSQSNSGVLALEVARVIRDKSIKEFELHGFDMRGSHYFGPYKDLRNTSAPRYATFQGQFLLMREILKKDEIKVVNKTPGSALRCFPFE
jgi:hypothetical protein